MPPAEEAIPQPEEIALDILFEDADLIVVNKPAGMVVHPAPGNWSGTLVNALLHHCKGSLSGIGGVLSVLASCTASTRAPVASWSWPRATALISTCEEQFADHGRTGPLERAYWGAGMGSAARMKGQIDAHLGRHPTRRLQRSVVEADAVDAKHAVTHYQVLGRFNDPAQPDDVLVSLVECRLETGRTHQIRVHMTHLGNPLLGDPEYGRQLQTGVRACLHVPGRGLKTSIIRRFMRAALAFDTRPLRNRFVQRRSATGYRGSDRRPAAGD